MKQQQELMLFKSIDLVQQFKNSFTLKQMKIINFIIASTVSPKYDKNFNTLVVKTTDLAKEICIIDKNKKFLGGKDYKELQNAIISLSNIQSKMIYFPEKKYETIVRWIEKPIFHDNGIIELKLDDDLVPYLLNLNKYIKYSLSLSSKMRSKYSMKLYELLKSYQIKKRVRFKIEFLHEMLNTPESYKKNFNLFNKYALEDAKKEINEMSDINIDFSKIHSGRKVVEIEFVVNEKMHSRKKTVKVHKNNKNEKQDDVFSLNKINKMTESLKFYNCDFTDEQIKIIYELVKEIEQTYTKNEINDEIVYKRTKAYAIEFSKSGIGGNKYNYFKACLINKFNKAIDEIKNEGIFEAMYEEEEDRPLTEEEAEKLMENIRANLKETKED